MSDPRGDAAGAAPGGRRRHRAGPVFEPGRVLLHRHFTHRELVWMPMVRVVSDDERGLLIAMPHGTPVRRQVSVDGKGPRDLPFAEWLTVPKKMIDERFRGPDVLKLIPPGVAHSVWWLFNADGAHAAWYVNLESPAVRWDDGAVAGIDTTDYDLDIWIWPDRTWEWKDEDELAERLGFGEHYWVPEPDEVWAEGRRMIPRIEAGEFPFDGTWCDLRTDRSWTVPAAIPPGWDRPRA